MAFMACEGVRAIDGTGSGDGFSIPGIIYEVDLGTREVPE